jgi:hypothetical protein
MTKRLTVVFDVTGFTDQQIASLTTAVVVQGEENSKVDDEADYYPEAPVLETSVAAEEGRDG